MTNIDIEKENFIEGIKTEYYESYFGSQSDYYLPRMIDLVNGERQSFNLMSFLFGIFWLLYKKLYIHAILIFVFFIAEGYVESRMLVYHYLSQDSSRLIQLGWTLLASTFLGFTGNRFYLNASQKKIEKIIALATDESERIERLKKKGKSNWTIVLITLAFYLFIGILSSSLV